MSAGNAVSASGAGNEWCEAVGAAAAAAADDGDAAAAAGGGADGGCASMV